MGELQDLVERFYGAFNAGDMDAAQACFADDVVATDPTGDKHGSAAWRAFAETFKTAAPDGRLNTVTVVEGGDTIAVEGTFTGTFTAPLQTPQGQAPPTGNAFTVPYVDLFVVREGKFARQRVYYDQVAMMTQLGLMPEGAPAG
jgi:steroid delta-isomerase-like uncharacterized protein